MILRTWLRDLRLLKGMHWPMVVVTGMLLGLGVLFIYSACYISEDRPVRLLYQRQLVWIVAGIVCYAAFAATDYRHGLTRHALCCSAWCCCSGKRSPERGAGWCSSANGVSGFSLRSSPSWEWCYCWRTA